MKHEITLPDNWREPSTVVEVWKWRDGPGSNEHHRVGDWVLHGEYESLESAAAANRHSDPKFTLITIRESRRQQTTFTIDQRGIPSAVQSWGVPTIEYSSNWVQ